MVFGDSNSARNWPGRAPAWPDLLNRKLGERANVINASCDGRTTGWDVGALNARECFAETLDAHAPLDIVIIALGTNDFKAKYAVAGAQAVLGQLERLIDKAGAAGIEESHLILASPPPMGVSVHGDLGGAAAKIARLAKLIRALCVRQAMPHIDLHRRLSLRCHLGDDGIHLNARGRQQAAKLTYITLKRMRDL
jgi:lysophospholipase L1-like esterase